MNRNTSPTFNERRLADVERLAKLEAHMENLVAWMVKVDIRLDHQDKCVDALKRQVWMATGAIALLTVLSNLTTFFARFTH